jgi:hypothetical protein
MLQYYILTRLPYEAMSSKSFKRNPVGKGLNYEEYQVYLSIYFLIICKLFAQYTSPPLERFYLLLANLSFFPTQTL